MSLLHTGGTEYEEEHTGIRKDTDSQPLFAVWQELCSAIDEKYDMEQIGRAHV